MDRAMTVIRNGSQTFRRTVAALLIAAAACAVYARTLDHGFVWDDHIVIEQNPFIQDWKNVRKLFSSEFFTDHASVQAINQARPIWVLSALWDHRVCGMFPGGWHLTNLLLHAANSVLVFWLAGMLLKRFSKEASSGNGLLPPFLAGLLFAIHPVHVEPVAAVSFRADLLCTFFVLSAFMAYVSAFSSSGRRAGEQVGPVPAMRRTVVSSVLFVLSWFAYTLGLLSKEMAVTLPFVLILFDYTTAVSAGRSFRSWRRSVVYAAYLAAWPAYLVFHEARFSYHATMNHLSDAVSRVVGWITLAVPAAAAEAVAVMATPTRSLAETLAASPLANFSTMSAVFAGYLGLLLLPFKLSADHGVALASAPWQPKALLSLVALSIFAVVALRSRRRAPMVWFGIVSFFTLLFPVSNLVPIHNLMAERYLYLPSVGFCLALGWALAVFSGRFHANILSAAEKLGSLNPFWQSMVRSGAKILAAMPVAALLSAYGVVTVRQADVWRDDRTLWETTVRRNPLSARGWYNLGYLAHKEGNLARAEEHYRRTLAANPDHIEARTNLAGLLAVAGGDTESALEHYKEALAKKPASYVPYFNAAETLMATGDWGQAVSLYKKIQEHFPSDSQHPRDAVNLKLGRAYAMLGNSEASEAHLGQVVPGKDFYQTHADIARFMEETGRAEEAEKHYLRILQDVEDAEILVNLGVLYHRSGRMEKAVRTLRRAVEARPRMAAAHFNLGTLYSDLSEFSSAEKFLREAVRLRSDYADAWYNLAVVLQRQGRIEEAVSAYHRVAGISPNRVEALSNLAGCYELMGDLDRAEAFGLKAVAADATRSAPYINLGRVYQRRGEWDKAVSYYQQALRADPQDVVAYNNLGVCYLNQGNLEKAHHEFVSAIRANPDFADAYYHLGLVLDRQGKAGAAVAAWNAALRLNANHRPALNALAAMKGK
jgi:protein O-mannosyl-transferase